MTETFRKTAPESLTAIPFNIPKPVKTELSNGLKVVYIKDDRYPIVNLRLAFRSGDINDPKGLTGLNSALASMLSEGTENRTSRQLAEEIERMGASLSARSGLDNTILKGSCLAQYSIDVLDLMSEIVFTPTFPEEELQLYKQNTIEGLKFQRSQPDFLADEQVARILYGEHPYSVNSPTPEEIEKIDRESLVSFHKASLAPNNAMLIAIGDFDPDILSRQIEEGFGSWEPRENVAPDLPDPPQRSGRTLTVVDRPGSSQSNIVLANLALKRNHPDLFPVLVMNQVLGAGASSRLFMNLREEKGFTYGAYSRFYSKRHLGSFEASSEVRTTVTSDSLKEFFFELNRIRDDEVSPDELDDAKNYLTGVFPIRAETQNGLTGLIVTQQLYDLPDDYLDTYRENVRAISPEDVQRVANKYIHPENVAIVIVGDADEVIEQAGSYADDIEVFDTEGNRKELESYLASPDGDETDVSGSWTLSVDAQGQKMQISLTLEQNDDGITGVLESMLGEGKIDKGRVRGSKLTAVAQTEFQGQEVELTIAGNVEGDSIAGTISTEMIPVPLEFTGKKSTS